MNTGMKQKKIGHLVGLWRYPVKSMGCEGLDRVHVSWFGLAGDRRWAFVRDNAVKSGFPWFTIRENPAMSHFQPRFEKPEQADKSRTLVRTPSGQEWDVTDPQLAAELAPQGARVIKQNRGIFDTFPLSLISTQTLDNLGESVGMKLDVQRFRPNFLVEAEGGEPYPEDAWVGHVIRIGDLRFRVDKRDGRCVVITVDPKTTQRQPQILRQVAKKREGCLGVYGSVVEPGHVAVGDSVYLEP